METAQEFAVDDLYLASYLKARGMKLAAIEKDGRHSKFVFHDTPERPKLTSDYIHDVPMGVSSFIHALKDLKTAIHTWDIRSPARDAGIHERWK